MSPFPHDAPHSPTLSVLNKPDMASIMYNYIDIYLDIRVEMSH